MTWRIEHYKSGTTISRRKNNTDQIVSNWIVSINNISFTSNNVQKFEKANGNGSNANIFFRCSCKGCKLQVNVKHYLKIRSVTKKNHYCIFQAVTTFLDCHKSNVIYLITYLEYHLQYSGVIFQKLHENVTCMKLG